MIISQTQDMSFLRGASEVVMLFSSIGKMTIKIKIKTPSVARPLDSFLFITAKNVPHVGQIVA